MSYSFNFVAATKEEAKAHALREFDSIVVTQPNHSRDLAAAIANLNAVIGMLVDDDTQAIRVECFGSLMWATSPEKITGATIHAAAWHVPKE
jgi:hypothetical protein